jgi:hypothetical protein
MRAPLTKRANVFYLESRKSRKIEVHRRREVLAAASSWLEIIAPSMLRKELVESSPWAK